MTMLSLPLSRLSTRLGPLVSADAPAITARQRVVLALAGAGTLGEAVRIPSLAAGAPDPVDARGDRLTRVAERRDLSPERTDAAPEWGQSSRSLGSIRLLAASAVATAGVTAAGCLMAAAGASTPGPSSSALQALAQCESNGNYADDTGNGYYGAYQFALSTWQSLGLGGLPSHASPAVQDGAVELLWQRSGWTPWPSCSVQLGLSSYAPADQGGGSIPAQQSYVVQPGDTLGSIAASRGLTAGAVASLNHLADPNLIKPGQVLRI